MEGRNGARPLTQRTFDQAEESSPVEGLPAPQAPPTAADSPPLAPIPRDPSDLELRARQLRWIRERERAIGRAQPPEP